MTTNPVRPTADATIVVKTVFQNELQSPSGQSVRGSLWVLPLLAAVLGARAEAAAPHQRPIV